MTHTLFAGTGLGHRYSDDSPWVLKNLDFSIAPKEIVCLVGANGSGKSTLARLVAGELQPTQGAVEAMPSSVAFRYQQYDKNVLPWYTAQRNLELLLARSKHDRDVNRWLEISGFARWNNTTALRLSGGQLQFLSLIATLVLPADLLILDEPFSALDPSVLPRVWKECRRWVMRHNKGCLIITHNLDEAIALADKVVLLSNPQLGKMQSYRIDKNEHGQNDLLSPANKKIRERLTAEFYGLIEAT